MITAPRVRSALAATALLASTLPTFGIEATLTDDATVAVSATTVTKKFGAGATLAVSPTQRALLRFDLDPLPADVTPEMIQRANLKLWVSGVRAAGAIGVKPVIANWAEATVAGVSAPATGAGADNVANVDASLTRQYLVIDVTEHVKSWRANANSNFGLQLATTQASITFDSKENGLTGRAPVLEIGYAGAGPQGSPGAAGTVAIGAVTTGAAGSSAAVSNSGTPSAAILNFTIPKGDAGQQGNAATMAVGSVSTGNPGTPAAVTNAGTSNAAVLNFTIPKGDKGDTGNTGSQGVPGAAATVAVGSVTTGAPGSSAAVANSGSANAAILNFTIPKGDPGATGQQGSAATVAVGSVTTGNPGTAATVTNSGTSNAAVLNFAIPKGEKGDTGAQGAAGSFGRLMLRALKTNQVITAGTVLSWNEQEDPSNAFTGSVFIAPEAGVYHVDASVSFNPRVLWQAGNERSLRLYVNRATASEQLHTLWLGDLGVDEVRALTMQGSQLVRVNAGDAVEIFVNPANNNSKTMDRGHLNILKVAN